LGLGAALVGGAQTPDHSATGATFAPGQRFDIRIEGDDLRGQPSQFTLEINGREQKREIFGNEEFKTYAAPPSGGVPPRRMSLMAA
jgi:hypothetical protein